MRYVRSSCVIVSTGVSLLLSALTPLSASTGIDSVQTELQADDLRVVQAGEKIYQAQCGSCHGSMLEGQADWRKRNTEGYLPAPPHDATGHTWHHADDLLFEITKYGPSVVIGDSDYLSSMPLYKNILTDEEIVAVLSFIKNTWPAEQRQWQEEVNGTQIEGVFRESKGTNLLDKLFK